MNAAIDCRDETAAAIFRKWNLLRYCQPRTFRLYAKQRRDKIARYNLGRARRRWASGGDG